MFEQYQAGPDRATALDQYRRRAPTYDLELLPFEPLRQRAIAWLALRPDDTVLDVGCGTGLSFDALLAAVGPHGQVVGIEQSPQMIDQARARVSRNGWRNVELLQAPAEDARLAVRAEAALLHFTHDVLQNDAALANVLGHLKPDAAVVASGLKWAPPWAVPINLFVWAAAMRSVSSFSGLHRPWQRLAAALGEPELQDALGGGAFLARVRAPRAR